MSITVKGQPTVLRRISLAKRAPQTFTSKPEAAKIFSAKTIVTPANAVGQKADGSYIFAPAPANAIGQNRDGSYILAQDNMGIAPSSSNTNGLPKINAFDVVRALNDGKNTVQKDIVNNLNDKGKQLRNQYGNQVAQIVDNISKGGGLITTPGNLFKSAGNAIEEAGDVAGNTAANIIKPIALPLLLGVAVYAFASSR